MAAEVLGVVLGGIPVAIWALEKYSEPFEAFHKYRISIETFRANLVIQNRHLQTTLFSVGLGKEPSSEELRECFETKFPDISRELMFIVQRMDEVITELIKNLDIDVNGQPNALADSAQWNWRRVKHSFRIKRRTKIIEDLRHWNEDLRRSLEKPEVCAEDDSRKVQDLKRRFNIQHCSSSSFPNIIPQIQDSTLQVASPAPDTVTFTFTSRASFFWCIAYSEDQGRQFSLGHDQTHSPKIIEAVRLRSLLPSHEQSAQQRNPYFSLPTKQRYGIATSVAWSVLHLSGTPWLGGYWDEKQANIFLEKSQDAREVLSRHPCISCVFPSRTVPEEPLTSDFKHLIPNRTVFALGILLIELCINKTLTRIQQEDENATPASLLDKYQAALGQLDEVYRLAGDSYGYAAERCVKFSFLGRDLHKDFDISQFRQQFYEAVVAPVQATYLMFPDSRIQC
ncbi:hypothetical protein DL768_002308 [Monosporascus sp. mg162]|nr:hypothetical protein DL768_002308 [Monosporascus sp. mg162]